MTPATLIGIDELKSTRADWARENANIAFVPTMGALHEGHLTLARQAKALGARVVVSIFVNPTQFGPNEDFAKYPRTITADLELLSHVGVDAVFMPNASQIYPDGFHTFVTNRHVAKDLEGAVRPGHFDGVLTVVLKLFNLVQPRWAIFGKKDYQQLHLIERMVKDLELPVSIVPGEIVREADGLAMSSRNRYLSPEQRPSASLIHKGLQAASMAFTKGERRAKALETVFGDTLLQAPTLHIDYATVRRRVDLGTFTAERIDAPAVLLVAVRLGDLRLIDNIELG